MFRRKDLDELFTCDTLPAVSLFLPTHVAGREIRQDRIRLKNLITQAATQLRSEWRRSEAYDLLAPVASVIGDDKFWRHQGKALAAFVAPGFSRVHRLPIEIAERVVIGPRFHVKPLLPVLTEDAQFLLLTISAAHTRLYHGSRWSFAEQRGVDLPRGIRTISDETEYEETHYAAPTGRRTRGLPHAQPLGDTPGDLRKSELIELLHRIAAAVQSYVAADRAPLILAALPEIQGHFRSFTNPHALLREGISENPDAMRLEDLHRRAYSLVAAEAEADRAEKLDRINALLGSSDGRATIRPTDIVRAAYRGQIDALFIAGDKNVWGRIDEAGDRIVINGRAGPGDIDLLDYAAMMALQQGGDVTVVKQSSLPPHANAAALLRYQS